MNRTQFLDKDIPGISTKKLGIQVGNYLVISYIGSDNQNLGIYSLITGKLFIKAHFHDLETAQIVAQVLDERFKNYMPILQDYPDADIVSLAKWSVDDGLQIAENVQEQNWEALR